MKTAPARLAHVSPLEFLEGFKAAPGKSCGSCTACCDTVPVAEIGLPAFTRCPKLRPVIDARGPGCSIYPGRPRSCRLWSCSWLTGDLPLELRPDRCGVVIDPLPDVVTIAGEEMPAAQLWVRPGFEYAFEHQPVYAMIRSVLDVIPAALWLLPPVNGVRMSRAFFKLDGRVEVTAAFAPGGGPYDNESTGARMIRAQELADRL